MSTKILLHYKKRLKTADCETRLCFDLKYPSDDHNGTTMRDKWDEGIHR